MCIEALRTTDLCEARGHDPKFQYHDEGCLTLGQLFDNRTTSVAEVDVYKCARCGHIERRRTS